MKLKVIEIKNEETAEISWRAAGNGVPPHSHWTGRDGFIIMEEQDEEQTNG